MLFFQAVWEYLEVLAHLCKISLIISLTLIVGARIIRYIIDGK